ncbi:Leucine-responsive regulatory protein [Limihaloglobus sulfuriphilus]|uniref:Leucine-responsive regulatory protein n=1 Tax=Limihaloglobus sulfuriphilus TaxID=1851148 RepID=A0A1Q2ME82_9BACT|nr:Lrp/AsnC family transcriptional regulator [Limihaloglobus sulfuriphilus]AQQ70848.1 Leucine-responsive regulatory protein [Limihaloglobus sulfuriphilus]
MQPDETDWKIIKLLSIQHESNAAIARKLSLSEGTVRQRIKRLLDCGLVRLRAVRNPNLLDNQQLAIVSANVAESRLLDEKASEIAKLKNVMSVSIVSGQYDLIIELLVDSNKGLMKFLTEELSTVKGVSRTESFVILKSYDKWI